MSNIDKQLALLELLKDRGLIGQGTYIKNLLELSKLKVLEKEFPKTVDSLTRREKLKKVLK